MSNASDVVVVATQDAWPLYLRASAYVCEPGRAFGSASYLGFYSGREIHPPLARILEIVRSLRLSHQTIDQQRRAGGERGRRLAAAVQGALDVGYPEGSHHDIVLLTGPREAGTLDCGGVAHEAGPAWTEQQRHASSALLAAARTTRDLEAWPSAVDRLSDDQRGQVEASPAFEAVHVRRAKQRGAVAAGLYDRPLIGDWLAWWSLAVTLLAFFSILGEPSDLPRPLEALLAAATFFALFGLLPAILRRTIRRAMHRRALRKASQTSAPGVKQGPRPNPERPPRKEVDDAKPRPPDTTLPPRRVPLPEDAQGPPGPESSNLVDSPTARPLVLLSPADVERSEVLREARSAMPYPVARAVRTLQLARQPKDQYEAPLRLGEVCAVSLGAVLAAWASDRGITTSSLENLRGALLSRGAAQGHWLAAADSLAKPLAQRDDALAGAGAALRRRKGGVGLVPALQALVEERNQWAHGGAPRSEAEAVGRARDLVGHLESALQDLAFLARLDWVLVRSSRYQRRSSDFELEVSRAMGDHPDFEVIRLESRVPLSNDDFYVLTERGPLLLSPLIVMRHCPACHAPETAYASKAREGALGMKGFDTGHELWVDGLVQDVAALFPSGKIGRQISD